MRADVLDEVPLLLEQVLLIGGDQQGGVALDHGDEAAQVLEVDVQRLGEVVVEVLHLVFEALKEGLVLLKVVHSSANTSNVFLSLRNRKSRNLGESLFSWIAKVCT